ncbi:hypothetical protein L2E82_13697 [Cichorium intybus]|uniref:Uncharacterized protein n=1 Tax=Cichorium intybus TaxID=13427 RepID=A0ACB9EXC0_CICIN|nr:hypothetical protein L2E82_13697 [Cichorium intybus]
MTVAAVMIAGTTSAVVEMTGVGMTGVVEMTAASNQTAASNSRLSLLRGSRHGALQCRLRGCPPCTGCNTRINGHMVNSSPPKMGPTGTNNNPTVPFWQIRTVNPPLFRKPSQP